MSQEEDEILKIIILGEGRAGKTEILSKYFSQFNEGQKNTINPPFYQIKKEYQRKRVNLNFYDAMGSEQFNAINTMQEAVGSDITIVIAGNNFDLCDKNIADKNKEIVDDYCKQHKWQHFYISSRTGFNISETFESLISSVLRKVMSDNNEGIKKRGKQINIKEQTKRKKGKGCI